MSTERLRPVQQDADMQQTNDQRADQSNTQDASHRSDARQDVAVRGHQSQVDQQRVTVTVQNHVAAAGAAPGGGQLEGRVLDVTGAGLAGCLVEVFFGPLIGVPVAVEETDRLGRFRLTDLPAGFYSLRAIAPGGNGAEQWNLRVTGGEVCRVTIYLAAAFPAAPADRRTLLNAVTRA